MATAEISHVSEEEENYLRMRLLVLHIGTRAVRVFFDKEFDPSCLNKSIRDGHSKLNASKRKGIINQEQWNLLYPGGSK